MISREQARERAEEHYNGGRSADERRQIDLYEFDEGYVAWTVLPQRQDPTQLPDVIGGSCIVIDKATGEVAIRPRLDPESVAEFYRQERRGETSA